MAKHRARPTAKHAPHAPSHSHRSTSPSRHRENRAEIFPLYSDPFTKAGEANMQSFLTWPLKVMGWMMSPLTAWMKEMDVNVPENFAAMQSLETDKAYIYKVPLPGILREQIGIGFQNGMIMLRVDTTEDRRAKGYYAQSSRAMRRAFPLPVYTDGNAITAELKNGLLTITIPKSDHTAAPDSNHVDINFLKESL